MKPTPQHEPRQKGTTHKRQHTGRTPAQETTGLYSLKCYVYNSALLVELYVERFSIIVGSKSIY